MSNDPTIPNNSNSDFDADNGSPANETRKQCMDRCQSEYNTCIMTIISGESTAQRYARCQSALTTCQASCPTQEC